ncbi:MAG: hypothetical protein JJ896_02945 [Rhodothermales bacterium]|nr:hypothetical protein [Rhodothermales bacterium]MBO6778589.1 hypothetical protein [Rhodothermales bacterium]
MTRTLSVVALSAIALFYAGCDAFAPDEDTGGTVTLAGSVLNLETNNPIDGAFVRVLPFDLLFEVGLDGSYELTVDVDSTMDLQVVAGSDGFDTAKVTVLALAGRVIEVPTLRLNQVVAKEPESGRAHSLLLLRQSANVIGVREGGSEEVASLTFQVVDSIGRPVVLDKSTLVDFSFGVRPGGGESIAPASAETDNNGVATVTLSSGTRAGVAQVIAETNVAGKVVRSQPVAVSIHGGLPDQAHFSVGPKEFNFEGLNIFGISNSISIIVGDQYANPVRAGTSVYFTSTHGVISGSVTTDDQGRGSVELQAANPLPQDGVAVITATTADVNNVAVIGQTPVVFSGIPVVTISPTTVALGTTYRVTVTDQNGNPLVQGTSINNSVEGTAVKAVGSTSIQLPDTQFIGGMTYADVARGPGITEFVFRAVENVDPNAQNPPTPVVEAVTVRVSGRNGRLELVLGGGSKQGLVQTSDDAIVTTLPDGTLRVQAAPPTR